MQSRKVSELEPVVNKNGITGTKIYIQPEGEIVHLHLSPGAHLAAHKTPVNVAFYVLEGTATFVIGDEEQDFPQDTIVDSPKDIPHAVLNKGDSDLRVLVIKMPKP